MKNKQSFNKKHAVIILKEVFKGKKGVVSTVSLEDVSLKISQKVLLTAAEIEQILSLMANQNYIDIVAKTSKKSYNYTIKLKKRGEIFLRKRTNKLADFFIGVFVYLAFILILILLVFFLKNLLTMWYDRKSI